MSRAKGKDKIWAKEMGTMKSLLIAKGIDKLAVLGADVHQLLAWMYACYGYRHFRLWRSTRRWRERKICW